MTPTVRLAMAACSLLVAACGSGSTPSTTATSTASSYAVTPIPTPEISATVTPPAPSPTATASPPTPSPVIAPPQPTVTTAELLAVAAASFPRGPHGGYVSCVRSGSWANCPFTVRLMARLGQNPTSGPGGGADPLCRCQNVSLDYAATAEVAGGGGVAHVVLIGGFVHLDLLVIASNGALLVDDTQCTGRGAATSIYVSTPPPCP